LDFSSICITGGAGFVGSSLAVRFRRAYPDLTVTAVDSLKRRGSELTLPRLRQHGVQFVHADIRCPEDLAGLPEFDLLLDCSAEPSVQAGVSGSPAYVLHTNLTGTIQLLELVRIRGAALLFLSTSRVYPLDRLNDIPCDEQTTRFQWTPETSPQGISEQGVSEAFEADGVRSFYGASKYASEHLIQEYAHSYELKTIVNRCGVLAGPWQMGKVDQGVLTLWVARHVFEKPLTYTGWGGEGKQVRDILHIDDLADLLDIQCAQSASWNARVFNVGGGRDRSVSLQELTKICRDVTGNAIEIGSDPKTSPVDVRIYVTDNAKVEAAYGWQPQRDVPAVVRDVRDWIEANREQLKVILG